jgi:hypothetical protein
MKKPTITPGNASGSVSSVAEFYRSQLRLVPNR